MTGNINYALQMYTTAQRSLQKKIIRGNLFWFCEPQFNYIVFALLESI